MAKTRNFKRIPLFLIICILFIAAHSAAAEALPGQTCPLKKCACTYLHVGDTVTVALNSGFLGVRSQPDVHPSDNIIARFQSGTRMQILEGPFCSWGWILWKVRTETGVVGYVPESNGKRWWLQADNRQFTPKAQCAVISTSSASRSGGILTITGKVTNACNSWISNVIVAGYAYCPSPNTPVGSQPMDYQCGGVPDGKDSGYQNYYVQNRTQPLPTEANPVYTDSRQISPYGESNFSIKVLVPENISSYNLAILGWE